LSFENDVWVNTLWQMAMIVGIAGVLAAIRWRPDRRMPAPTGLSPAAA
jgi:hypothetical protein